VLQLCRATCLLVTCKPISCKYILLAIPHVRWWFLSLLSVSVMLKRLYYPKIFNALYVRHLLLHRCRACILSNFPRGLKCNLWCNKRASVGCNCNALSLLISYQSASPFACNCCEFSEWISVRQSFLKHSPHCTVYITVEMCLVFFARIIWLRFMC
jgi:hypothetical protein